MRRQNTGRSVAHGAAAVVVAAVTAIGLAGPASAGASAPTQKTTASAGTGTTKSGGPGPKAAQATRGGPVAGTSYRVRRGDTVIGLARRAGVSPAAIVAANGLKAPAYMIRDGAVLKIPKKGAVAAPTPTAPATRTKAPAPAPTGGGRNPTKAQVGAALESNARRYGLPADLVKGIAWQESGWRQEVVSSTGAVGVMQLMPGTAKWVGDNLVRRRIDSQNYSDNVEGGSAYLKWLFTQTKQDERLAIASYYQGPGSVKKSGVTKDGERYVAGVQANRKKFR